MLLLVVNLASALYVYDEDFDRYRIDPNGTVWRDVVNMFDGDWNTYGWTLGGTAYIYMNYSKPSFNTTSALWQIKGGEPLFTENLSLPFNCFNTNILKFKIASSSASQSTWSCYNGSDWQQLKYLGTGMRIYEEAIIWNTFNNLTLNFREWGNSSLFNGLVNVQLIGSSPNNKSTSVGDVSFFNLSSGEYTIIYSADGFEQGSYVLDVDNETNETIDLYLQNTTGSSLVLISVTDKFGTVLSGVEVIVQRWDGNAWVTDQVVKTDFQGRAEAYYVVSTVFYNHVLKYGGDIVFGVMNSDFNKKLIFAEDVTNGISFAVDILGVNEWLSYNVAQGVSSNLSYIRINDSSGYFRFFFSDDDYVSHLGCLRVYRGGEMSLVCNNCSSTSTGTLICGVSTSGNLSYVFTGSGFIDGVFHSSIVMRVGVLVGSIDWGVTGYFVAFLLCLVSFFIFLSSPTVSVLFGSFVFVILGVLGVVFKNVNYSIFLVFLVISFLIARIKGDGGLNG